MVNVSDTETVRGNDAGMTSVSVWECSNCVQAICWTEPSGERGFPAFIGQEPPLCIPLAGGQTPGPPGG